MASLALAYHDYRRMNQLGVAVFLEALRHVSGVSRDKVIWVYVTEFTRDFEWRKFRGVPLAFLDSNGIPCEELLKKAGLKLEFPAIARITRTLAGLGGSA